MTAVLPWWQRGVSMLLLLSACMASMYLPLLYYRHHGALEAMTIRKQPCRQINRYVGATRRQL